MCKEYAIIQLQIENAKNKLQYLLFFLYLFKFIAVAVKTWLCWKT
jgi:hypothetical protein